MKQAWNDLKSFVTVAMVFLLILVTNLITAVFTYYFAKKENKEGDDKNE